MENVLYFLNGRVYFRYTEASSSILCINEINVNMKMYCFYAFAAIARLAQSYLHAPTRPVHGLAGLIPILAHFLMKVFKVFSYFFSTSTVRGRQLGLGG